jgi:hypothetical protein
MSIKLIIITILFIPSMIYVIWAMLKIRKMTLEREIKYMAKKWRKNDSTSNNSNRLDSYL